MVHRRKEFSVLSGINQLRTSFDSTEAVWLVLASLAIGLHQEVKVAEAVATAALWAVIVEANSIVSVVFQCSRTINYPSQEMLLRFQITHLNGSLTPWVGQTRRQTHNLALKKLGAYSLLLYSQMCKHFEQLVSHLCRNSMVIIETQKRWAVSFHSRKEGLRSLTSEMQWVTSQRW